MTRRRHRWGWLAIVVVAVAAVLALCIGSLWSSTGGGLLLSVDDSEHDGISGGARGTRNGKRVDVDPAGASSNRRRPLQASDAKAVPMGWPTNPSSPSVAVTQPSPWPGGDNVTFHCPVAKLKTYFASSDYAMRRDKVTYPVGGDAHLSATPNVRGGTVLPPLCGSSLATALGVTFSVDTADGVWSTDANRQPLLSFTVTSHGAVYRDVVIVGRLVGRVMLHAHVTRVGPHTYVVVFGPLPWYFMQQAESGPNEAFSIDVLVTWVGPFFFGQRWVLPDRNDNPPLTEKKRKCLALSLHGECDRFGLLIVSHAHMAVPNGLVHPQRQPDAAVAPVDRRPLCAGAADVAANGFWARMDPVAHRKEEWTSLADPVGLNTFNGSTWRWHVGHCRVHVFTRQEALQCFQRRGIRNIGLFGDSMMVEFVNQLSLLLDAPIRQGKYKRLRYMEFTAQGEVDAEGRPTSIRVRFSRSYTTREGQSVIASPATILNQLQSTQPEVILGNLAVLHWQQNMMPLSAWQQNLQHVAQLLTPPDNSRSWQRAVHGGAYYLGPTMVQMGRTQGLEPSRTSAFADAAVTILGADAHSDASNAATVTDRSKKRRGRFSIFAPYEASVSRRESAYDGQHWACYHTYGGVSQMFAHMWLHQLCHDEEGGA